MPRGGGGGLLLLVALEILTVDSKAGQVMQRRSWCYLPIYPSEMFIYDLHIFQHPHTIFTKLKKGFELPVI